MLPTTRGDTSREDHISACLDQVDWQGKKVLEIGLGQGAELERIIRRGAHWSRLDLTQESIERVGARLAIQKLPHGPPAPQQLDCYSRYMDVSLVPVRRLAAALARLASVDRPAGATGAGAITATRARRRGGRRE